VKIYEACSGPVLLGDTIDIIERTRFAFFFPKSKNHRCDPDNDPDDGDDALTKFHALLRTPKPRAEIWPNGSGHPGEVAGKFRYQAADGCIIITNNQRARLLDVAGMRKLRPRSMSASGRTGRRALNATFDFGRGRGYGRPPRRAISREHLPRVGADDARHLRQSDAGWAVRPLSKEVPSRQSRSSMVLNDPQRNRECLSYLARIWLAFGRNGVTRHSGVQGGPLHLVGRKFNNASPVHPVQVRD
jgi:hypothetical protein